MGKTSGHSLPNILLYYSYFDLDHPVLYLKPINTLKMTEKFKCVSVCLLLIFQSHTQLNQPAVVSCFVFTVKTRQWYQSSHLILLSLARKSGISIIFLVKNTEDKACYKMMRKGKFNIVSAGLKTVAAQISLIKPSCTSGYRHPGT